MNIKNGPNENNIRPVDFKKNTEVFAPVIQAIINRSLTQGHITRAG